MKMLVSLVALSLLSACDTDGTTGIAIQMEPGSSSAALTNGLIVGADFDVIRLEALVTELKLLPDKDYDVEKDDAKFKAKGDFYINVLDPEDNTIPPVPLPAEVYKKVEFKFGKVKDGAGLDGTDATVALDAVIGTTTVRLRLKDVEKVTLRHVDGIALTTGTTSTFIVALDIPGWFSGVDVAKLDADSDGVVLIDTDTNKDAYGQIKDNVKTRIKLLRKP